MLLARQYARSEMIFRSGADPSDHAGSGSKANGAGRSRTRDVLQGTGDV